jgi:hypothetical protein
MGATEKLSRQCLDSGQMASAMTQIHLREATLQAVKALP